MAQDAEDVIEELDTDTPEESSADSQDDSQDTSSSGSGDTDDSSDSKPANRFAGLGSRLSERLESDDDDDDEDEDSVPTDRDDDDDEDDEADEGDKKASDRDREDSRKPKGGKEADDEDDEEGENALPFRVIGSDGSRYELDIPEDARIEFVGDGKEVKATIPELVRFAQKGVAFDRVSTAAGVDRARATARISELEEDVEANEELVKSLILGTIDEELEEKLRKLFELEESDPEAIEGKKALARERAREQSEAEQMQTAAVEASKSFWAATEQRVDKEVSTFSYLDAEDKEEILSRFNQVYLDRRAELVKGIEDAEQIIAADRQAVTETLNVKTLRRVMKELDSKYAKRAGKGGDVKGEAAGKREAQRHNDRNAERKQRAADPARRAIRTAGTPPSNRERREAPDKTTTFEQRMERSFARLKRRVSGSE